MKALAHPVRERLLSVLSERTASPAELADELGEPLANVSYHVRILTDLGMIELVRTQPRRGAIEHFYAARPEVRDTLPMPLPSESSDRVREAASRLAPALQSIVLLTHGGMSIQAIALAFGLAEAEVLERQRAARAALASELAPAREKAEPAPRELTSLHGRVVAVEADRFHAVAGEEPGDDDLAASLPLTALTEADRDRVRPGALFEWSLERWQDPARGLMAASNIALRAEGEFSEEQQHSIRQRADEVEAQLSGFRQPSGGDGGE